MSRREELRAAAGKILSWLRSSAGLGFREAGRGEIPFEEAKSGA